MMETIPIIVLLAAHFVGDYICQTPEMAAKKSRGILWLSIHSGMYSLMLSMGWLFVALMVIAHKPEEFNLMRFIAVLPLTYLSHWIVKYFSSRLIAKFERNREHTNSFMILGIDQFLCQSLLVIIYKLFI